MVAADLMTSWGPRPEALRRVVAPNNQHMPQLECEKAPKQGALSGLKKAIVYQHHVTGSLQHSNLAMENHPMIIHQEFGFSVAT